MMRKPPSSGLGRAFARAGALACTVMGLSGPVAAAPDAPRWDSSTTGLAVRGISSFRVSVKGPEVWYASIQGNKATRMGLCESRDKGKIWTRLRTGLEDLVTERDAYEITLDPKDEKILYAVWRGKIFKSVNAGQSWEDSGSGTQTFSLDRSQSKPWIAGVEVDPTNSKRLLAGTVTKGYHGGLFESKDAGKTWGQIAGTGDRKDLLESGLGHDAWPIALDKADKYLLCGGATGSAWFSLDHGSRFKLTQPGGAGVPHRAFQMTPMFNREVWLAESRGLWRSRDAGENWEKTPRLAGPCTSVDIDPGNRKAIFALVRGQGLYRTENMTSWDGPKHQALDPDAVFVHPHAKNTVFLTSLTTGLHVSTDKGETFQPVLPATGGLPESIPAITHVGAHPADAKQMMAVSDTGAVFASQDRGATWAHTGNLGVPVTRLEADPKLPGTWLAAGPGVFLTSDLGATWTAVLSSADVEDRVTDLARLPDGTWYAQWERDARIVASKDGGKTWDAKNPLARPNALRSTWASDLAVDPKDPKHLLVATRTTAEAWSKDDKDGGPYESKDGGATWALLDAGLKNEKGVPREGWNHGVAAGFDDSGVMLYAADGVGLFRWDPAGVDGKPPAWAEVGLTNAPAQPTFNAFLVAPASGEGATGSEIVMQLEGLTIRALLRSTDGGKTFAAMADPGTRLVSLSVDPTFPGRYLAGDAAGDRGVLVYAVPGAVPPTPAPTPAPVPAPTAPTAPTEKPVKGLLAFTGGADKTVRAWGLDDGHVQVIAPPYQDAVLCAVLSQDGTRLFTGSADKRVRISDGRTGEKRQELEGATGAVGALAVTADGTKLYAGDEAFVVHVYDLATGKAVGKLEGHTGGVTALALSADGSRLYSASRDKTVRIWDTATAKSLVTIPGHPAEVLALALSPDGARLFTGGRDADVRVFDAKSGAAQGAWPTKSHAITGLALSPDGTSLYVAGDVKGVEALGTADGKATATFVAEVPAVSVALSADGLWICAGGEDGALRLWHKGHPEAAAWASARDHGGPIHALALTRDVAAAGPAPGPTPPAGPPAMGEPSMGDAPAMGEAPAPAMGEAPAKPDPSKPAPPADGGMSTPPPAGMG